MTLLSVVSGCFNEADKVTELYERICGTFARDLAEHAFDLIFIDNASSDRTVEVLKRIGRKDKRVKIIVNNRNVGQVRSGGILQAKGDGIVAMASDLQDPPEMIPQFVGKWEEGYKVVLAEKVNTEESSLFSLVRKAYCGTISRLSDIELAKNATGFGLYDRRVKELFVADSCK